MDRWTTKQIQRFMDKEPSPEEPGGSGSGEEEGELTEPEGQNSPPAPTGIESAFSHEALRGKTTQEIEAYVKLVEDTNKELGQKLNRQHRDDTPPPPPPAQSIPVEEDEEIDPTEFFSNPGAILRKDRERTVREVRRVMEEIVTPFRENLSKGRKLSVLDQLVEKHPGAAQYRTLISTAMEQTKRDNFELAELETVYFSIMGRLAAAGKLPTNKDEPEPTPTPTNLPPNMRPSSHPSTPPKPTDGPHRELSENERTLARRRWPELPAKEAYKRYLTWQELDEGDVIGASIGREERK